jgi:hypothetical protein
MKENQTFYLRLDGQTSPVRIDSHFTTQGIKRVRPHSTVGHLIAAFQQLPNSPLASTFLGNINIYSVATGVETLLDPGDPLPEPNTSRTPLIIKSGLKVKLSPDECFSIVEENLKFSIHESNPNENVERYFQISNLIKESPQCDELILKLNEITSMQFQSSKKIPIVVLSGCSGVGKTQTALAIKARLIKDDKICVYCIFSRINENSQVS